MANVIPERAAASEVVPLRCCNGGFVDGDRPSSDLTLRTNRAPPLRLTTPASHPAPPSLHHSMSVTSETSYIEHGDDLRISGVSTIFSRRSFDAGWPEIHAGIWRLEGSAPYG